jgi:hypothetical protein
MEYPRINYKFDKDTNSYSVEKYYGGSFKIEIPETYKGKNVTKISKRAFKGSRVKEVILPNTIKIIEKEAFRECKNLEYIKFPSSIESLDQNLFTDSNIKEVDLSSVLINYIPGSMFFNCKELRNVKMGKNITELYTYSFYNCIALKELVFNDFVYINKDAFYNVDLKIKASEIFGDEGWLQFNKITYEKKISE